DQTVPAPADNQAKVYLLSGNDAERHQHSFPTRRSSDLAGIACGRGWAATGEEGPDQIGRGESATACGICGTGRGFCGKVPQMPQDRKSTRLNSSHVAISYVVICLKKKSPAPRIPSSVSD